jgi:hypothetical protein
MSPKVRMGATMAPSAPDSRPSPRQWREGCAWRNFFDIRRAMCEPTRSLRVRTRVIL